MTVTEDVDYITTYFENKALTKVIGAPDYEQLNILRNELKANACSVQSDLGGGRHGHLGLLVTAVEYAFVSATPFIRPVHPGPLVIPAGIPNYQQQLIREHHREDLRIFNKAENVEKALIKQLS